MAYYTENVLGVEVFVKLIITSTDGTLPVSPLVFFTFCFAHRKAGRGEGATMDT